MCPGETYNVFTHCKQDELLLFLAWPPSSQTQPTASMGHPSSEGLQEILVFMVMWKKTEANMKPGVFYEEH